MLIIGLNVLLYSSVIEILDAVALIFIQILWLLSVGTNIGIVVYRNAIETLRSISQALVAIPMPL